MPYLGNDLQVAQPSYRNIDDISGSFNSSTTSFPLLVSGSAPVPFPINSNQCLISVAGVVQRPDDSGTEGFRISGGNIIFSSAPSTGADFFGVILAGADYVNVGANFPSGSAAAPSITFDSDLDTGIYNSAANQVSVSTAGSERLRIDSAGQVEVVSLGTASAPAFSFTSDSNTGIYSPGADQVAISTNGAQRVTVDANGKTSLSSTANGVQLRGTDSVNATWRIGTPSANLVGIGAQSTHSIAFGSYSTDDTTFTERARFDSSGRLGIGTSAPNNKLTLQDGTVLVRSEVTTGASNSNHIGFSATSTGGIAATISSYRENANEASALTFNTWNGSAFGERMRVSASGSVGIGSTSDPGSIGSRLWIDTTGDTYFTANTTGSGNLTGIHFRNSNGNGEARILNNTGGALTFYRSPGNEAARIDSSGRLLVGTSSALVGAVTPEARLQIIGNTSNATDRGARICLGHSAGAASIDQFDLLGAIHFTDNSAGEFASIMAFGDGVAGASDYPGRLVFSTTADGASSPTERFRIRSDGNMGFFNTPGIYPNTDNAAGLGFSGFRWSSVYAANGTIQTSDQRAKTEITDAPLGIDFIKSLRPVSYKWIEGGKRDTGERDEDGNYVYEAVPGQRTHWGFIAQEVKEAVDAAGVDFGGWVLTDKDDPDSQQALRYDQFIAPLTKALQEALAEIDVLKAKVAALEAA